jgi:hypothetical protein
MADLSGLPLEQLAFGYADALERASHAAWQAKRAEEQAAEFRLALQARLSVGEVVLVDDDTMLVMAPPKPDGRRSVDTEAIHRHIEVLGPLGLGPEDDPRPRPPKYPTVNELERREAALGRYGIALAELIVVPPLGPPRIELQRRAPDLGSRAREGGVELPDDAGALARPAPRRACARERDPA